MQLSLNSLLLYTKIYQDIMEENISSQNINSLWIQNIFENIKLIEGIERLAREGCVSVVDYLQIPIEFRSIYIAEAQYKNLKLYMSELRLLINDISLTIGETEFIQYKNKINEIYDNVSKNKYLYVKDTYSEVHKRVIGSEMTASYNKTLELLSLMKVDILSQIKHLLFVTDDE